MDFPKTSLTLCLAVCAPLCFAAMPEEKSTSTSPGGSSLAEVKPANYVNRELPRWVRLGGEIRLRMEDRTAYGFREGADDMYLLSRLRLNVEMAPTPWLQLYFQGQDSRFGGVDLTPIGVGSRDRFDLKKGYAYFRLSETSPVGFRVGRQDLSFGAQRLVGAADWSNTARSFDAVRMELTGKNMRADIFAASVVKTDPAHFNKRRDGENLHGIYAAFKSVLVSGVFEPYLLYKTNPRVVGPAADRGSLGLYTAGYRLVSEPGSSSLAGFDYSLEYARQWGHYASADVHAWAGYAILGYTLRRVPLSPRVNGEFSYATGDKADSPGRVGTFDNLYPTNHGFYGAVDHIGWQNIKNQRTGVELKPNSKMKLVFDHHWFWLANRHDHLYNAGLGVAVRSPLGGARHTDIGREVDIFGTYSVSNQITLGAGFGHLSPGRFLKEASPGSRNSFGYLLLNYKL